MLRAPQLPTPSGATSPLRAAVAGSLAGKAVEMVTLLALATVVPRLMGPQDYGRFSLPLTIVTIGSLAMTLGGPAVLARYVPTANRADRPALARTIGLRLARGRGLQLAAVAVGAVVASLVAPSAFPPVVTAVVVGALAANVGAQLCLQVGLGLGRTGPWSFRYPVHNAVLVIAVLVLDATSGHTGAVAGILIAGLATLAFGIWVVAPLRTVPVGDVAVPDGAIRFGIYQASGAALTQFAQRGGVIAAALLAGSTRETGYTALAIGIALGATYAVLQTFTVMLPHLAATTGDRSMSDTSWSSATDAAQAERPLRRLAGGLLAVIVPAAVLAVPLLDRLVPAVVGEEYAAAAGVFVPALAIVVLAPVGALATQVTALRLRPEVALWCGSAAAAGFVGTALVATPTWGAAGAVVATLVGMSLSAIVAAVSLPGAVNRLLLLATAGGVAAVLATGMLVR